MEDYRQAALRHWKDADLLHRHDRLANTDQLLGLAGECAVKNALLKLPAFARDGRLREEYRGSGSHIDRLWSRVRHQSLQVAYPGLTTVLNGRNLFADWTTAQRYQADDTVSAQTVADHWKAAR